MDKKCVDWEMDKKCVDWEMDKKLRLVILPQPLKFQKSKTGLIDGRRNASQNTVKCLLIDMAKISEHLEDCGKWKAIL